MFIRHSGRTKLVPLSVTTSTAISAGAIVSYSSNLLIAATASTTALSHPGVLRKAIVSTDSDYATARQVLVEVPLDKNTEWEADTTGSTYAEGDEVDLSDSLTINRGATSIKVAMIRKVLSTTKSTVVLKLAGAY